MKEKRKNFGKKKEKKKEIRGDPKAIVTPRTSSTH